jgi:hypothetical protein
MAKNYIQSESNVIFPVFQQSSNRQTDVFRVINSEICRNYTFYNDITQLKSLKTHSITALSSVCMIINLLKIHYQKIIEIDFENSENFSEKYKFFQTWHQWELIFLIFWWLKLCWAHRYQHSIHPSLKVQL